MIRLQELELVFGHTDNGQRTTDGWTDRRDIANSILDLILTVSVESSSFLMKANSTFKKGVGVVVDL